MVNIRFINNSCYEIFKRCLSMDTNHKQRQTIHALKSWTFVIYGNELQIESKVPKQPQNFGCLKFIVFESSILVGP